MPDLKPFIVSGLALGGVYALSGVGLVILFRASGVLNFAYGAVGALSALVSWQLIEDGTPDGLAFAAGVLSAVVASVAYGAFVQPRLADRDAAVMAAGTLGFALALLGVLILAWSTDPRVLALPSSSVGFDVSTAHVTLTQVIALGLAVLGVIAVSWFLRSTLMGITMRSLAGDRELTAMLGVRVRRVELTTWAFVGGLAGVSGILFANLVSLQASALTFLVIASLAAGVIGRFRSLLLTLVGGLAIGVVQACATPFASVTRYRDAAPFVLAFVALLVLDWLSTARDVRAV
jgi:branched-chain amino acid transport system permease protein